MKTLPNLKPPHFALLYLLIALLLHYLFQDRIQTLSSYPLLGILLLALGIGIMFSAVRLFKEKDTPLPPGTKPTALITSGPYRFTRNPMYLGMTLILLSVAFLIGSPFMLIAPIAFFITINSIFIPYEEEKMQGLFGQAYLDYKKKVRRWL